ncbi:MAG TPA: hypothetical protein VGY55_02785 [Pirellulales bacterium]|jgi:hypothetical protein|nr:hypothetical protein [Pirellulales bacterium]
MSFTTAELEAYLDESLPVARMAAVEDALRRDPQLLRALEAIHGRRDAGVHSLGEIWRRNRLSCPTRQQLGSHLLGILPDDLAAYIRFHLDTIGCRYCQANLADLQSQQQSTPVVAQRRRKYLQSSAGYLKQR